MTRYEIATGKTPPSKEEDLNNAIKKDAVVSVTYNKSTPITKKALEETTFGTSVLRELVTAPLMEEMRYLEERVTRALGLQYSSAYQASAYQELINQQEYIRRLTELSRPLVIPEGFLIKNNPESGTKSDKI